MSDELFISINSDEEKPLPKRRRARILPPQPKSRECENDSDSDPIAIVEETDLQEIPTKCIPLLRDDLPNEDMLEFTKCHTCGKILGEHDEDDDAVDQWWCCCKCLGEFCPNCSDAFLSDESGLCHECDDPDAAFLHAVKSRKRSEV